MAQRRGRFGARRPVARRPVNTVGGVPHGRMCLLYPLLSETVLTGVLHSPQPLPLTVGLADTLIATLMARRQ